MLSRQMLAVIATVLLWNRLGVVQVGATGLTCRWAVGWNWLLLISPVTLKLSSTGRFLLAIRTPEGPTL